MTKQLTGRDAIDYADDHGLTLCKYADPTEDARTGLSVDEARAIAAEDPSLVYLPGTWQRGQGGGLTLTDQGAVEAEAAGYTIDADSYGNAFISGAL